MSIILPNDVSNYIQEKNANANIIWFDASVNTNDEIEKIKEDLQSMNNCLRYHNNFDTFNDYIESINKKNLFCIISGISGNETLKLLSSIHKTSLLTSVFVVSDHQEEFINLKEKFHRKVNICGNYIELMESIKENIIDVNNQMKMFSFYDRHEQSILDLSDESAKFLW